MNRRPDLQIDDIGGVANIDRKYDNAMADAVRMQRFYRVWLDTLRETKGMCRGPFEDITTEGLSILDYGSGERGVSRRILEGVCPPADQLLLYDPEGVAPSNKSNIQVITESQLAAYGDCIDVISLAYVLPYLEPDAARILLTSFHERFPSAHNLIVTDYVMAGRTNVLELLTGEHEQHWHRKMGDAEFVRTRTRYSIESLLRLMKDSGWNRMDMQELPSGIRCAVVASKAPAEVAADQIAQLDVA